MCERTAFALLGLLETDILTIGRATVTIDGIVVVQSTCRVDITDIVSVPRVRSTHPPIRRRPRSRNSYYPKIFLYLSLSDFIQAFSLSSALSTRPVQYSIRLDSIENEL